MFLTAHGTVAIIIAKHITNPPLAIFLAVLSHYALDAIPHGDDAFFGRFTEPKRTQLVAMAATIDILIAIPWFYFLYSRGVFGNTTITLLAIFASMLPDFLMGIHMLKPIPWLKWNRVLMERAHRALHKTPLPAAVGFCIQALFFAGLTWYLF